MMNYELDGLMMNPRLRITASSHRTAFLKPNLFNKLVAGFQKKIEPLRVKIQEETTALPVVEVTVEPKAVAEPKKEISNDVKQKNYTIVTENNELNNSKIVSTPHKLLISSLFLGKLLGNRKKAAGLEETIVTPIAPITQEVDKTDIFQECADLLTNKKQYEAAAKQCEQKLASLIKDNNISDDELANYINGDIPKTK